MKGPSTDRHYMEIMMIFIGFLMILFGGGLSRGPNGPSYKIEYLGKKLKTDENKNEFPVWATRLDRFKDHDTNRIIVQYSGGLGPTYREEYHFEDTDEMVDPKEFDLKNSTKFSRIEGRGPLVDTNSKMAFWVGLAIFFFFLIISPIDMQFFPA